MLIGPNYVYKCPKCGNLLTRRSLRSGNTFGAKIFSDGKQIAPMLPEFPNLTKCKKCDKILWLNKLKEIGMYEWGRDKNQEWENADKAEFLGIEDYYNALIQETAENKEEEVYIRRQIWWAYNDRIRKNQKIFNDENDEFQWLDNITKLKNLITSSTVTEKIMLAEINRNLGDFENCINIIQSIEDENFNWLKKIFINECKKNNKWVIELK